MVIGEKVELRVEHLAYGGRAVARAEDGRAVFVAYGCPGDLVEASVTAERKSYLEAETTSVLEPSPDRVTPPCPYFGECGGCQWQHVAYSTQLEAKRQAVADALTRIGRLDASLVRDPVKGAAAYGYRNKVELAVVRQGGSLSTAYSAWHERHHVPVETCHVLPKRVFKAPKALTGVLRYLSKGQDLGVERVALRAAVSTADLSVDLWSRPGPFPRSLAARTFSDSVRASGVTRVLSKDVAARKVSNVEVLGGKGAWREKLGPYDYLVSPPSFFQVNTRVAEKLASLVADALQASSRDRVLDLFAGVGTFTLPLASTAGEVVAVESSKVAAQDLARNLDRNRLDAEVVLGDASDALEELGRFDLVVVDPPRLGLSKDILTGLGGTRPRRLVYVSCDPATLARDAAALNAMGYRPVSLTPLDMFPQTYHVETMAVFDAAQTS